MAKIVPEKEHSGTFINPGSSPKIRHQIEHFETLDVSRLSFQMTALIQSVKSEVHCMEIDVFLCINIYPMTPDSALYPRR
jgi:hypothetical protein